MLTSIFLLHSLIWNTDSTHLNGITISEGLLRIRIKFNFTSRNALELEYSQVWPSCKIVVF